MLPVHMIRILVFRLTKPVLQYGIRMFHTLFCQQSNIIHDCRHTSSDEATTREANEEDLIALLIVLNDCTVSISNVGLDGVGSRAIPVSIQEVIRRTDARSVADDLVVAFGCSAAVVDSDIWVC